MVGKFFVWKIFILGGGGGCLGFCFLRVLGVGSFFLMAPFLHPSSIRDTPCRHCFNLYILGSLSRHVKSVHPPISFVSHAIYVISSLQVFSPFVLLLGFIPFASWGWLWVRFNSILGLFEFCFTCPCLFHRIP
jgi:hypothetical protein